MFLYMKTTVNIPDALFKQVKSLAARKNTNLKTIINESLRRFIIEETGAKGQDIEFCTFKGNGLHKGVSWDSWSEVRDMIYDGRGGLP